MSRFTDWVVEKLNPAQARIAQSAGTQIASESKITYQQAFQKLESVNRSVSMLVNAAASLDYDVKDKIAEGVVTGIRQKSLNTLLNFRPNPYQSTQEFRQAIFTDLILEGNVFIHFDGVFMYHLPAASVEILTDTKTFIRGYRYNGMVDFKEPEVFHFRDMNSHSIYRGASRLESAQKSIGTLYAMQSFQENFFENGAIPGFALGTENTLSQISKDKTVANWVAKYNPKNGARKPIIIDSGLKPLQLFNTSFKEMDFEASIASINVRILETLGVPPVLLDGGNQANISPNLRLFYLETVVPIVRKYVSAMEYLCGYDIEAITSNVSALQPDLKDIAAYQVGLVNGGITTADEAREELRYEPMNKDGSNELRVPANIAGSATQPNIGGAPKKPANDTKN